MEVFIEFYRGKDEQIFLEKWTAVYGIITENELDDLYAKIADEIDRQVKNGKHELGEVFSYKEVPVGKSDYNSFHNLFVFEQD